MSSVRIKGNAVFRDVISVTNNSLGCEGVENMFTNVLGKWSRCETKYNSCNCYVFHGFALDLI